MRIAIVVHVFYGNLWPEIRRHIRHFDSYSPDVFITTSETADPSVIDTIRRDMPHAAVERLPNRGFDVGPFVKTINEIDLDRYEYIVKLHTKRNRFGIVNFMPLFGGLWRKKLLAFCNSRAAVRKTLDVLSENDSVGMIGGDCELLVRPWNELAPEPLQETPSDPRTFVAGTMFIVRSRLLKAVRDSVSFEDFAPTTRQTLDTLAHKWERRLGYMVTDQGMSVCGARPCRLLFTTTLNLRKRLYYIVRSLIRSH